MVSLKWSKVYHTNPKCKKLPKEYKYVSADQVANRTRCNFCDEGFYKHIRAMRCDNPKDTTCKEVMLNGDFPKRVMIPIYVTSDGTEFGCEIDALRHENTLLKKRIPTTKGTEQ